jgi:hypothetical protein
MLGAGQLRRFAPMPPPFAPTARQLREMSHKVWRSSREDSAVEKHSKQKEE